MGTLALSLALASLAAASWAAPVKIPDVSGETLGVDPYVQEFQTAMEQANARLAAVQAAILAVPVPAGSKAAALAAGAKAAADYAAVDGIVLKAEQAHAKFLAHILGYRPADLDARLDIQAPAFSEKRDADARPRADRLLKGSFASAARAAPQQRLAAVSSAYSYNSSVGPVGSGFETSLAPTTPQLADMGSIGQTTGGAASVSGGGMSSGASDGPGVGSAAPSAAPPAGPAPASLSSNSSNVAQQALQRAQERQQAAQEELQRRQQQQSQSEQQAAQMAQQMLSQAGQALGKTQDSAGGCASCNQQKQQQSDQAAAAAPAP